MQSTLVDAGPLVALFDSSDRHHANAVRIVRLEPYPIFTTWAVLAEVAAVSHWQCWIDCLAFVESGAVTVAHVERAALPHLIAWAKKYRDLPMDLADASLVALAHQLPTRRIITIDADFTVYRLDGRAKFEIIW